LYNLLITREIYTVSQLLSISNKKGQKTRKALASRVNINYGKPGLMQEYFDINLERSQRGRIRQFGGQFENTKVNTN